MAARIATGECLLSAPATLAEADAVWAGPQLQKASLYSFASSPATQIRLNGAYRDLALSTLLQLGIPPEDFRARFETGKTAITPAHFDPLEKRFRARPDCGF